MEPNWGFRGVVLCLKSFCGSLGMWKLNSNWEKND